MPLTRHPLDDFLRHGGTVFAALEALIEKFNAKAFDLLSSSLGDLLLDRAPTEFDLGKVARQNRPRLLQFRIVQGLALLR